LDIESTNVGALYIRGCALEKLGHVDGAIDPLRDVETIGVELALADVATVTKRHQGVERQLKSGKTKELEAELVTLGRAKQELETGKALRDVEWTDEERKLLKGLSLLTMKPMLFVVNVSEEQLQDGSWETALRGTSLEGRVVPVCVKMEAEFLSMNADEKKEYLETVGQTESGLDRLIVEAYRTLGLITFLTTGEMETRAWTIVAGTKAPQAAGVIHTDFEKTFIRVEVTNWKDIIELGSEAKCREKGLVRIEGKDYVMQDGDVCYFRVGA
jgi:GTP-binding protein YchF